MSTVLAKANMIGMMEAIEEYLRSCCGFEREILAYITRKTITVQNDCIYPWYATPDNK